MREDKRREVLGIFNKPTESALGWGEMLTELQERGARKIGLVCADGLILWTEHLVSPFLPKGWAFLVSKGVSIVGPFFLMYFVRKYAFQKLESKRKGS